MRLDQYVHEHFELYSRNKAQELVRLGVVTVDGHVISKPSYKVRDGEAVTLTSTEMYVSRAAQKLKGLIPLLPFSFEGMTALDIGASTGGFTQVLLEEKVMHVDAVDVGSDQLHHSIRNDSRVTSYEHMDIRHFNPPMLYDVVVSDVSFISLLHILEDVDRCASRWIILLFKPQYEVGREAKRDRHGVVKDPKAVMDAMRRFEAACHVKGWNMMAKATSTLSGKEGNIEYCYCFEKG